MDPKFPSQSKEKRREYSRKWRANNREKVLAGYKRYHANNPGLMAEWGRRRRKNNPDYSIKKYGLSLEQFDELVLNQGGMCAICGEEKKLRVDHDHGTNKIRGLLCHNCNVGLGHFQDSTERLALAQKYLMGGSICLQ